MKTMLLFLAATLVLAGCKEDEKIPPVAGFTLDNETPVQWDKATITSTATGATETTYVVTGRVGGLGACGGERSHDAQYRDV